MSGLDLVPPYLTKVAIDRHIARGDAAGLARVAGLYLLTLAAAWLVRYLQNQIMQMTGQRIMQDMRREIYAHLQRLHVGYFDRNPVGRLMTRVTTDVDAVNELFTSGVVTVFGDLFALARDHGRDARAQLAARARHLRGDPALLPADQLVPAAARGPRSARRGAGWHGSTPSCRRTSPG